MPHETDREKLHDLVLRCRIRGHRWPDEPESEFIKTRHGYVVGEIRLETCERCGAERRSEWSCINGAWYMTGPYKVKYPEDLPYLLKGDRLPRAEAWGILRHRQHPEWRFKRR